MIFFQVNKLINSLSTGYQEHTSHGKDVKFFTATTQTYLCLQMPHSQRWRPAPHMCFCLCPAEAGKCLLGEHLHPTCLGQLPCTAPSWMGCRAPQNILPFLCSCDRDGSGTLLCWYQQPSANTCMSQARLLTQVPKCAATNPHDTKALQPRAADGWTTTVLVACLLAPAHPGLQGAQHQQHKAAWFLFSRVLFKVHGMRCFMGKLQVSFVSAGDNQVQIGCIFCKNIHSPVTFFPRAVRVSITGFWDLVPRAFWCALDLLEGLVPVEDSRIYSQEPSFRSQTLNHELRWAIVTYDISMVNVRGDD